MDDYSACSGTYSFGPYRVDPIHRVLLRQGAAIALPPRVFDTLLYLVENAGRLVGREELLHHVWNGRVVEQGNINQAIYILRRMFRTNGATTNLIVTSPTRGYRFVVVSCLEPQPVGGAPAALAEVPPSYRPTLTRSSSGSEDQPPAGGAIVGRC